MNSQMKWFVSWGLGGSWVHELLFLWSWVSHPPCVNVCTNLEALWIPYYWYFVDASSHVCVRVCVCMCVCVCGQLLIRVQLFATPWTIACQAPLSMGFSRQEYWSGLPFPPGDLPYLGVKPCLLHWQADSLPLNHLGSPIPQVGMNMNR